MSIHIGWGNHEETVIIWKFMGNWDSVEFRSGIEQSVQLLKSVQHHVNIIFDMQLAQKRNQNLVSLKRAFSRHMPDNLEKIVVLANTIYWQRIFSSVNQVIYDHERLNLIYTQDVNEAYALLDVETGSV